MYYLKSILIFIFKLVYNDLLIKSKEKISKEYNKEFKEKLKEETKRIKEQLENQFRADFNNLNIKWKWMKDFISIGIKLRLNS